jgi:hypothetical protein
MDIKVTNVNVVTELKIRITENPLLTRHWTFRLNKP